MSFDNRSPQCAVRWSKAFLAPVLLLAASSAIAQTVNQMYSPNGPLFTNECTASNIAQNYTSRTVGSGAHVWYVNNQTGLNKIQNVDEKGNPVGPIVNGNTADHPLSDPSYAAYVAIPGDLICFEGSVENATPYAAFAITHGGSAAGMIKLEAIPGDNVVVEVDPSSTASAGIAISASYVQVSGFTVMGPNYALDWNTAFGAAAADYKAYPQYNVGGITISLPSNSGPNPAYPSHINILQNIVYAFPGTGIAALYCDYVTISGNVIYDNAWYSSQGPSGLSVYFPYDIDANNNQPSPYFYKIIITDNNIYNNMEFVPWSAQGKISDGEGIIIDSNQASSAVGVENKQSYGAYQAYPLIANNTITGNGGAGVEVFASSFVDVVDNSLFRNVVSPGHLPCSDPSCNPQSTVPIDGEMLLSQATDVRMFNNLSSAVGYVAPLYIAPPNYSGDSCIHCYANWNGYYSGSSEANYYGGGTQGSNDINSVYTDPNYVNLGGPPYIAANAVLQVKSLENYGTGWLAIPYDINGNPRTISNSYTVPLGAYANIY